MRFDTDEDGAAVSNVYLSKGASEALGNPDKIQIEVSSA